jgi:hypothetical protein
MCLALRLFFLTVARITKATLFFLLSLLISIVEIIATAIRTVLLSTVSIIFIGVTLTVFLLGLIIVNNTVFFMQTSDIAYECIVYKTMDGSVTYGLKPIRDWIVLPTFHYTNDVLDVIKDGAGVMVDRIENATNHDADRKDAAEVIDAMWDWLFIDWLESPYRATPPRWGPNELVVPFEGTFIRAATMFFTDNFVLNRGTVTAVERLFLSFIRGDTLSGSCYFAHLPDATQKKWAFRGCKLFDPDDDGVATSAARINGTYPDYCYDFTDDMIHNIAPHTAIWMGHFFSNITDELENLIHSFHEIDVCGALKTGTCAPTVTPNGTFCQCQNYNCSFIPWWIKPNDLPGIHCMLSQNKTVLLEELGSTCDIVDACWATTVNDTCARVCEQV